MLASLAIAAVAPSVARAEEILTVAVFNFEASKDLEADYGAKAATLVNAHLSAEPALITVERAELEKLLGEQELGLTGTVTADTAAKVGHLTGAKVLVTGRAFKADRELLLVAKIIGTETGRVFGEIAKANATGSVTDLTKDLAAKIAKTIASKGDTLVAKVPTREDRVAKIKAALKDAKLPVVSVKVDERHFGGPVIDPAAETELGLLLTQTGFTVLDAKAAKNPNLEITGEAFSAYGMRKGNLVSCRSRVEIKVVEKATGKVLAVDRQTSVGVDIAEQVAAKSALQTATAELAERLLPKLGLR